MAATSPLTRRASHAPPTQRGDATKATTTTPSSSLARLASWHARVARAGASPLPSPPRALPLSPSGLEAALYAAATAADEAVRAALPALASSSSAASSLADAPTPTSLSPAALAVVWAAGVATSLSPCTLSVLPLTLGYLAAGGVDDDEDGQQHNQKKPKLPAQALAFSAGLATTLAGLGVASALAGRAYGAATGLLLVATTTIAGGDGGGDGGAGGIGSSSYGYSASFLAGLPAVAAGGLAVVAGLALLDALPPRWAAAVLWALRPPPPVAAAAAAAAAASSSASSSSAPSTTAPWPRLWRAYAAGLVAALAASPCATPVLASILAWVSATRDPASGGLLLLCYSSGYVAPLLVAGVVAERVVGEGLGGARDLGALRGAVRAALASGAPELVSRASGFLLVAGGVYAVLSRVVPVG